MLSLVLLAILCGGASSTGSHSLRYFHTSTSPNSGIPEFVAVGYVDELVIDHYDSEIRRDVPRQQWMAEREGEDYWRRETQKRQGWEQIGKADIQTLLSRTNQSGGIHTLQTMYGCELRRDGTTTGFYQDGWDGKDSIVFDKDNLRWIAVGPWDVLTKQKWDQNKAGNQQWKAYLDGICIEWLRKYLQYGEKELRAVAPSVSFTRLGNSNKLSCVATGFYPQSIEVTMHRDEKNADETYSSGVRPNHDGTYQMEKHTDYNPKDQAKFSCVVDHEGLKQKIIALYEPKTSASMLLVIVVVIAVLLAVVLATVGIVIYRKKAGKKTGYNPATTSDKGDSSSNSSTNATA